MRPLRSRLIITLCTFSLLLTLVFCGLIIMTGTLAQDSIFNIELKKVTKNSYNGYIDGNLETLLLPEKFTVAVGLDYLDQKLVNALPLESLGEGIYESQEPYDYHYTVTTLPDTNKRLYVFYDVTELEHPLAKESIQWMILITPAIVTTILGMLIGLLLADKIISPVTNLAERVRQTELDLKPSGLADGFAEDEVGELAKTLENYTNRLSDFIVREQEFTRNVSHELRTPLAVVKNGAELLRERSIDTGDSTILDRIDRAVIEMEGLITTFMLLAREDDISSHFSKCEISLLLEELVGKYSYLLSNKNVQHIVVKENSLVIEVPALVLRVILGNLIRNAFQYTTEGVIEIRCDSSTVQITNQSSWQESSEETRDTIARGIGHSITARLCERFGYTFTFSTNNDLATATVTFFAPEDKQI